MAVPSLALDREVRGRAGRRSRTRTRRNRGLLFVLPALAVYLLYVGWPITSLLQYSATDWDGLSPTFTFVGFDNYVTLLTSDRAFRSGVTNNLLWALITVTIFLTVGFVIAFVLTRPLRFRNWYRTAFFLPTTASLVVIGFVWQFIYDYQSGPLNGALRAVGLADLQRIWLADPQLTIFAVIGVATWAVLGFFIVVQLAAIQSIPRDLFESASIDGAGAVQQLRYIAVPLTAPTRRALLILATIGAVNEFGFVFLLSRGGPFHASEVMAYQIYDLAFILNRTGYAAALSVVLLAVSIAITIPQLILLRRSRRTAAR